jgi:hypothetical protein
MDDRHFATKNFLKITLHIGDMMIHSICTDPKEGSEIRMLPSRESDKIQGTCAQKDSF